MGDMSVNGFFSGLLEVLDAPSRWGRDLGNKGLSDEAILLAQRYGELKTADVGDDVSSCALKEVANNIAGTGGCKPDAGEMSSEVAGGLARHALKKVVGSTVFLGADMIKDVAMGGIEVGRNHRGAIELMAKHNVPGFSYKEVQLGAVTYHVWADATAETLKENGKIQTHTAMTSATLSDQHSMREHIFNPQDRAAMQATESAATNQALGSAQEYVAANGIDGYKERLKDEIDNKLPGYVAATKPERPAPGPAPATAAAPAPAEAAP